MIAHKLQQMSSYLYSLGASPDEVATLTDLASNEINEGLKEIVAGAIREVEAASDDLKADEFLKQIQLEVDSGYVQIGTTSGNFDFSEPPYPMVPWLLKNPKISKDGSLYKVIPVGATNSPRSTTIKDIDAAISRMAGSTKLSNMVSDFNTGGMQQKTKTPSNKPVQAFRTVTSKQDQNSSWVQPPKNKDLTAAVMDVNYRIREDADRLVDRVVAKYTAIAENANREY